MSLSPRSVYIRIRARRGIQLRAYTTDTYDRPEQPPEKPAFRPMPRQRGVARRERVHRPQYGGDLVGRKIEFANVDDVTIISLPGELRVEFNGIN